jgi:hypothetical protein
MLMIGVEFEFAAARRIGHSKEGGASGRRRRGGHGLNAVRHYLQRQV